MILHDIFRGTFICKGFERLKRLTTHLTLQWREPVKTSPSHQIAASFDFQCGSESLVFGLGAGPHGPLLQIGLQLVELSNMWVILGNMMQYYRDIVMIPTITFSDHGSWFYGYWRVGILWPGSILIVFDFCFTHWRADGQAWYSLLF